MQDIIYNKKLLLIYIFFSCLVVVVVVVFIVYFLSTSGVKIHNVFTLLSCYYCTNY